MTDNRTTELRRMLDERCVKYDTLDGMTKNTIWYVGKFTYYYSEDILGATELTAAKIYDLTPEQAIAVTLGSEREKRLEKLVQDVWAAYSERADKSFHPAWEVDSELARRMAALELLLHVGRQGR